MKNEVKLLRLWLSVEGNTQAKIAAAFGYKSSIVINQWLRRGAIPSHQLPRVMEYIQHGGFFNTGKEGADKASAPSVALRG
jgi:hypothetical protein